MRKFNLKFYDYFNIYGYDYWYNLKGKNKYMKKSFHSTTSTAGQASLSEYFFSIFKILNISTALHKLQEREGSLHRLNFW